MIKNGMLAKPTLASGSSDIRYDPYTLIVKYPTYSKVGKTGQPGRFRSVERSEPSVEALRFDSDFSHELVHWFQHHGTTIGCFLSELRSMQYLTTVNWSTKVSPGDFSEYISRRASPDYRPFVNLSSSEDLLPIEGPDTLRMFPQIWYDHKLIDALFFDSPVQQNAAVPRGMILGEIVGDIVAQLVADQPDVPGLLALRDSRKLDDSSVAYVAFHGRRLTTHLLMEAAASATELANAENSPFGGRNAPAIRMKLEKSDYGLAARIMLARFEQPFERLAEFIPTLGALIDAALNPPLPPIVLEPQPGSWCWSKLYPPMRFFQLLDAALALPPLAANAEHEQVRAYQSELCERAGLADPAGFSAEHLRQGLRTDFEAVNGDVAAYASSDTLFQFIRWVQLRMWQERAEALPLFTNLAACKVDRLSRLYGLRLLEPGKSRWASPPLIWSASDLLGYSEVDHCFENLLCLGSVYQACAYEVAAGAGPMDLGAFPPDVRGHPWLLETIEKSLAAHFPGLEATFAA